MPRINRTMFENAARRCGYSKRKAKNIASSIMARPDFAYIYDQLTLPEITDYPDPTGEDAVWRVLTEALTHNSAVEVS